MILILIYILGFILFMIGFCVHIWAIVHFIHAFERYAYAIKRNSVTKRNMIRSNLGYEVPEEDWTLLNYDIDRVLYKTKDSFISFEPYKVENKENSDVE